jgi:hypothetical protein
VIGSIRRGAKKYKDWLVRKYKEEAESVEAITPLLEKNQPLPNELKLDDFYEEQGARAYRNRFRDMQNTHGLQHMKQLLHKYAANAAQTPPLTPR